MLDFLGVTLDDVHYIWILLAVLIGFTNFLFPSYESMWSGLAALMVGLMVWGSVIHPASFTWQLFWFFLLTTILLLLWFFVLKKKFKRYTNDERDSSLVGIRGIVSQKIEKGRPGEVELFEYYHGIKKWKAEADESLNEGEEVVVYDCVGIKFKVRRKEL